ncbi:MAG TPA: hypothetical protein VF009_01210 [Solirubrobacterales bacterium]
MKVQEDKASIYNARGRASLLAAALLAGIALLLGVASSASALSYGMMWQNYNPETLSLVQRSGATVYRLALDYSMTSGGRWSEYDKIVEAGWKRGITILPMLVRTGPSGNRFLLQEDPDWNNWSLWAKEAVERYGVNGTFWAGKPNPTPITAWEVWNEPNLKENNPLLSRWNGKGWETYEEVQPRNYGNFLVYTAAAIQSGSQARTGTNTQVLFGGLYMPSGMNYNTFLEQAYEVSGLYSSYTGLSIHPYSFVNGVSEMEAQINSVRAKLNSLVGGSSKSLWITELGWPVAGSEGFPPGGHSVSEAEQASLLTQSFNWVKGAAAGDNIQLVTWYNIQDFNSGTHWDGHCGLLKENGEFHPAWAAYQKETGAPQWEGPPILGEENDFPGPHVVAGSDGTVDTLWRTPSGGLERYGWSATGGSTSGTIPGELASVPHGTEQANGTIDAYWRTPSNQLGHAWRGAGATEWSSATVSAELASDPHVIAQNTGVVDVFWRTTSGYLGHYWHVPGAGSFMATVPEEMASDPYPVVQPNGTYDVFWRTPSGNLGHYWYTPGGNGSSATISAELASPPHAVAQSSGVVDVFWRTPSNQLGHYWYVPGTGSFTATQSASVAGAIAPAATTESATAQSDSATLSAKVNPKGSTTTYQFEYGKTTSYGSKAPVSPAFASAGTSPLPVSAAVSGLEPGVTYHYRVVATNEAGTTNGEDRTFTTDSVAARLSGMAVTEPFNGSTESLANFGSKWSTLGWAGGGTPKGSDTTTGWRPVDGYPTVNGTSYNSTVSDAGSGIASVATMAVNPANASRYFSVWLDMPTPTGTKAGYELRFTDVSTNVYTVTLSKWSGGSQTVLATRSSYTFVNGNSFALVDQGGTVSAWTNTGSGFSQLLSASDSMFSSGNAGLEGSGNITRLTNFKVGSL